jgi:hypothetical protein
MGRLPKKKVDKILEMLEQGYTTQEIVEEIGCSESSVHRYRKKMVKTSSQPNETNNAPLFEILTDTILSMITHIELGLDQEQQENPGAAFWRYLPFNLLRQIANINPNLFKTVLNKSEFYVSIGYIFSTDRKNLNDREKKTRSDLINLLKTYYPEKLGELIN